MPNSTKQILSIGGVLIAVAGTVFWWGWDMAVVAESVKRNTKAISIGRANDIDTQKWKASHTTLFVEQVFRAQNRERRLKRLEEKDGRQLQRIIKMLEDLKR